MRPVFGVLGVGIWLTLDTCSGAIARGDDSFPPPFIDHTEWVYWGELSSLRIFPTASGRAAAGELRTNRQAEEAWNEVLGDAPDADQPGMRAQFLCHWLLAEFGEPGKRSWNIEPWRPLVTDAQMLNGGCNPGGGEEPH